MCLYCICIAIQILVGNPVVIDVLVAYLWVVATIEKNT